VEAYHRETGLSVKLVFLMGENESLQVEMGCHT